MILEREGVSHRWECPGFILGGSARAAMGNSSGAIFGCVNKDARLESRAPSSMSHAEGVWGVHFRRYC